MPAVAAAGGLPARLGKYEIMMPLADGGMARIYIARSTGIGSFERHVVLKLILPERANDQIAVGMFLDEARLAASLNHQNVAQVFEVGEDAGIHYLAMEYVHGQDLRALLAKAGSQGTRVPLELALTVIAGAAAGLNHAHERRGPDGIPLGIVHRDVSPSNIMVGYDGAVKLLDFGIAKAASRSVETQNGIIKGKFAYMAPEQCRGRDVDRRSDVFSLGIILYEVTTQHRCFRADSDFDTMHRIVTGDVVRPTRLIQGYPQALEAIVMKALAVDANQRYQSAGMLLEAVESFAVSSRMSLSTMSLGRFMREMFGDQTEPWLAGGMRSVATLAPHESTISKTNGTGDDRGQEAAGQADSEVEATPPPTVLELPRSEPEEAEEHAAGWNAKSYPPAYATAPALDADLDRATSPGKQSGQPISPPADGHPAPAHAPIPLVSMHAPTALAPSHAPAPFVAAHPRPGSSPPLPLARPITGPGGPFAPTGSASGPAPTGVPPVSTRQASTPGLTGSPRGLGEPDSAVVLRPKGRFLVIGIGLGLLALVIVVALASGRSAQGTSPTSTATSAQADATVDDRKLPEVAKAPPDAPVVTLPQSPNKPSVRPADKPPEPAANPPEPIATEPIARAPEPAIATPPQPPGDAAVDESSDESIIIRVVSDPPGADVLLAGKPIGTTPLDTKIERGTGSAILTVHRSKYQDVSTKIDLSGDFAKEVTLKKLDDKIAPHDNHTTSHPPPHEPPAHSTTPKKPACQAPNQIDPFDSRPVCK